MDCFSSDIKELNPLEEFYKNSSVLITGATGFLGSVLVEKLLRCFDIKKMYLLIRSKNHESAKERIDKFVQLTVRIK